MNEEIEEYRKNKEIEAKVTIKRIEFEGGGYEETRVEEVKGGFIITKCKSWRDKDGCHQYDEDKEVTTENPLEEKLSLADKLEQYLNK